jgi:hypothetical protein
MANKKAAKALAELEAAKRIFGSGGAKVNRALTSLATSHFADAESLIHFHEALLFLRAYPPNATILKLVERTLRSFNRRVDQLVAAGADLSALDNPEVSGIAGGSVTSNFSYAIVRWLVAKYPTQLSIDWDWFEEEDRFGATMPRFLPLLEDDAMVEAHVPFQKWLDAARGRTRELTWLIQQFESLALPDRRKAELYDALKLHVTWRFSARASRTLMRQSTGRTFFHAKPLIQRREISLRKELSSPMIPIQRLSRREGERILNLARETSAVRYRELHGFTYGDAGRVLKAELGRGTDVFVTGVPPANRLPLRAYHAALVCKNGLPVAYFEGISICERMESGFNLYYTFRYGETAWLYARILRLMRQLFGVTVFSIDPYQVGHENEEGIESGAFWFYRKLGFRPVNPELMKLTEAEEQKMSANAGYRTPARTLRKLASGHMLFGLPGETSTHWDRFHVRNIGLVVQRRMARDFDGNSKKMRNYSAQFLNRTLDLNAESWTGAQKSALENLALVLGMIPGLAKWNPAEKALAVRIIRAKAGADEALYLKLMQRHDTLRQALIGFGSK